LIRRSVLRGAVLLIAGRSGAALAIVAEIRRIHSVPVQCHRATFMVTIRYLGITQPRKVKAMKKIILAVATAATLAVTALAAPAPAEARGGRVAAGVGLGLLGGAIAGAAIANSGGYYGPGYGYYGGPVYAGAPCYWQRQRFWDGYGWRIRRVQVCG
jgi:hypothetical protein